MHSSLSLEAGSSDMRCQLPRFGEEPSSGWWLDNFLACIHAVEESSPGSLLRTLILWEKIPL